MAYFEITGVPLRAGNSEFSPTVSLSLEKGRGLSVISDDGKLSQALVEALLGYGRFVGEIYLNGIRIDPIPARNRKISVLGPYSGIVPSKTVLENLELAVDRRNLGDGESAMLIERELADSPLSGLDNIKASNLSPSARTFLAAARYILSGCELLLVTNLPVKSGREHKNNGEWHPGENLDLLLNLKSLFRRFRATWISTLTDTACVHALSDHLAIFERGNLVQEGSLRVCINAPATRSVADFLTFPKMNYRKVKIERDGPFMMLQSGRYVFNASDFIKRQIQHREGDEVFIGIRPEDLNIRAYQSGNPATMNLSKVIGVDNIPGIQIVRLDLEGIEWTAITPPVQSIFTGQLVELRPDPDKIHLFHPITGINLLD